jgi:hypothetical protein
MLPKIASVATLVEVAITHWRRRQAAGRAVAERLSQFVAWASSSSCFRC